MIEQEVTVINSLGIHARPASLIVQTAGEFDAEIKLEMEDVVADAKSIMSVMMLAAARDSKVTIRADGADEAEAVKAVAKLFEDKFNED
jgi:phosphocarrier protein